MNLDIVLRGDTRNFLPLTIKNFMKMVIDPLLLDGHDVRTFTTMWFDGDDVMEMSIIDKLNPTQYTLLDKQLHYNRVGYTQWDVFQMGMSMVENTQQIDRQTDVTLFLRFDTLWKQPITNWLNLDGDWDVLVPWKEYEYWWLHHNRISDVFHIIKNKNGNFDKFRNALNSRVEWKTIHRVISQLDIPCFLNDFDTSYRKLSMESGTHEVVEMESQYQYGYWMDYKGHHLYVPMVMSDLNVDFAAEGYYDSNTYNTIGTKQRPTLTNNPLYVLVYPNVENCMYRHDDVNIMDLVDYGN
jgi:hypothetical protein